MDTLRESTVADIRDDLNRYDETLPVLIEDSEGRMYEVGEVVPRFIHGQHVITVTQGKRVR